VTGNECRDRKEVCWKADERPQNLGWTFGNQGDFYDYQALADGEQADFWPPSR